MSPDELPRIAHDPAIFESFYREHVEAVQRFVARRVDDPQLAADLTAEVFLAAVASAPAYRADRGEPVAWLFGVARNVVRLGLAGAGVAVAAATAVLLSGGDPTTPAYAVEARADGTVTVEIHSLRDADGLERKLRAAGVPAVVDYLPEGKTCAAGRYRAPAPGPASGRGRHTVGSGVSDAGPATFTIDRETLRRGQTLVVESSVGTATTVGVAIAEGPVGPCVPVDA